MTRTKTLARLVDVKSFGEPQALVGDLDKQMSVDLSGVHSNHTGSIDVGIFNGISDELVDQQP
jgi:hypothetical protein